MRDSTLHAILEGFAADAAAVLRQARSRGAEVPFELAESEPRRPGATPLYCYRPLTEAFIAQRLGLLRALPSCAGALRALAQFPDGVQRYLRRRGEQLIPADSSARAELALRCLLACAFAERSDFAHDRGRFSAAYAELEGALYEGRSLVTVLAPLLGVALDCATPELALGDGLSLVAGRTLPDAPIEAVHSSPEGEQPSPEPNVLAVVVIVEDPTGRPVGRAPSPAAAGEPVALARARFARLLAALGLFAAGEHAIGGLGWVRHDDGPWRPVALGDGSRRPGLLTLIPAAREEELRSLCRLLGRRTPVAGEVAWALSRYQMGRGRPSPFEALSDYLLALRALLEPEGPSSGRLAGRLAALCAEPERRGALAARAAHAVSLERGVIAGLAAAGPEAARLIDELAEHLRALLRDIVCGHLPLDVRSLADELIENAALPAVA